MQYRIELTPEADEHLDKLTAREQATLIDQMAQQLSHEPGIETRNRKRMQPGKPGFIAPWELRVEDMRVLYVPADVFVGVDTDILHAVGVWGGPGGPRSQRLRGDY